MTIWMFRNRVSVGMQYCGVWPRPMWYVSENGGRQYHECFDCSIVLGRVWLNLTVWGIGRLSKVLRFLPVIEKRQFDEP